MKKSRIVLHALLTGLLVVAALNSMVLKIEDRTEEGDAPQYLAGAYHLAKHGVYAGRTRETEAPVPTIKREPGYSAFIAAVIAPSLLREEKNLDCLISAAAPCRKLLRTIKYANAFLVCVSALIAGGVVWLLSGSVALTYLGGVLVAFNSTLAKYANTLYSENLAVLLLTAASAALLLAALRARYAWTAAAGLLLGALTLTKAAFLYFFPVALVWLAACHFRFGTRRMLLLLSVFAISFWAVVAPWMARNHVQFGEWAIAGRGGSALQLRAAHDTMTNDEARVALFLWHPAYGESYLKRNGYPAESYARLKRGEESFRYYSKELRPKELGVPDGMPRPEYDGVLKQDAMRQIAGNWKRHLLLTPLFLYRGVFATDGWKITYATGLPVKEFKLKNGWIAIGLLFGTLISCALLIREQDVARLAFFSLAAYSFCFHALATHFITRYSMPTIPVLIVGSLVAAGAVWRSLSGKPPLRMRSAAEHGTA
jgi:4-amino-4-deoxy-L-arabinose transferase-like glycosyltransferase